MSILPVGIGPQEGGYQIERSLRFNSADSAYLNRTFSTPTNNKIFTFSAWVKRSTLASYQNLFTAYVPSTSFDNFRFTSSDQLEYFDNTAGYLTSTQVFRDVSAWYHVMAVVDTTQATSSNRVKLYVNGTQITAFSATAYPSQNQAIIFNSAVVHNIGRFGYSANAYLNGYITEVNFIDGQALDPTSFGEYNSDTGVWQPKAYTGSYGTNGFYLDFADNSSTTALGYDAAGSNDWTPNNFSVTAGAGNDSLVDTPTPYGTDTGVGGEVRGNYCTWNPLDKNTNVTIANGNLDATYTGTTDVYGCFSTFSVSSGKWYAEFTATGLGGSSYPLIGIRRSNNYSAAFIPETYVNLKAGTSDNRGSSGPTFTAFVDGDVLGVAFDADTGEIFFAKNGTWLNSGDPATGAGEFFSGLTDGPFKFGIGMYSSRTAYANFGQRPFAYAAPSGFKALCTQNLPDPTVVDGGEYFNTVLYTGNGSTQSITGVGFQPDWVWVKSRSATYNNCKSDVVRGAGKELYSNLTNAETTFNIITSFDSDGFSVSTQGGAYNATNWSGQTYVAWNWKAGGTGVSNTDGSIASTVSANTTAGFSVVTYTGTGSAATVGHGLGSVPSMMILANRSTTHDTIVYHKSLPNATYRLYLNLTNAQDSGAATSFNSLAPTSSVINLGSNLFTNGSGSSMVAYVFAPVEGYSAFGSFVGNGSTDGPMIYTGFKPAFVLVKNASAANSWRLWDNKRPSYNVTNLYLSPDTSGAEGAINIDVDFTSNGFKIRNTNASINGSGNTIIYAAFAENPFKYSLAR